MLCVWEQGANMGHLTNLRQPIEIALAQGFEVFLAARELHNVRHALTGLPVAILQAPFKQGVRQADQSSFLSFTHLMGLQCFSSADELEMYLRAWRAIFSLVRPDLCLFESSPTALVAAHGLNFKKVLVGTGFFVPPAHALSQSPFLPFPTTPKTPEMFTRLREDDAKLLALIRAALQRVGAPELPGLGHIYAQSDAEFLNTWPVLDPFGERQGVRYIGTVPLGAQAAPSWPDAVGPKVFGYLQNFPALEALLHGLTAAKVCALLLVRDVPAHIRQTFSSPSLRFVDHLVDLPQVADQAAWVVNHGNHSTMATFALAGIPQLLIPRHQEQLFTTLRMVSAGAAVMAYQDQPAFTQAIAAVASPQMKQRAKQVADQCAPFDLAAVNSYMAHILAAPKT